MDWKFLVSEDLILVVWMSRYIDKLFFLFDFEFFELFCFEFFGLGLVYRR